MQRDQFVRLSSGTDAFAHTFDIISAIHWNDAQLDPALWNAIFGGAVTVGQHEPLTLTQDLSSYDAGAVYGTSYQIYIPDPGGLPPSKVPSRVNRVADAVLPTAAEAATPEHQAYAKFLAGLGERLTYAEVIDL